MSPATGASALKSNNARSRSSLDVSGGGWHVVEDVRGRADRDNLEVVEEQGRGRGVGEPLQRPKAVAGAVMRDKGWRVGVS